MDLITFLATAAGEKAHSETPFFLIGGAFAVFFFTSRRRHTRSVSAFLLNRSSDLKHSVDRFVIVSIFIPKLRLILILNSVLGSSDSLVFSELFHSLAPRPLAARSISDFLLTYLAT